MSPPKVWPHHYPASLGSDRPAQTGGFIDSPGRAKRLPGLAAGGLRPCDQQRPDCALLLEQSTWHAVELFPEAQRSPGGRSGARGAGLDPMICPACQSESLMIYANLAPKGEFYKSFWHNRWQCKSYQRQRYTT